MTATAAPGRPCGRVPAGGELPRGCFEMRFIDGGPECPRDETRRRSMTVGQNPPPVESGDARGHPGLGPGDAG